MEMKSQVQVSERKLAGWLKIPTLSPGTTIPTSDASNFPFRTLGNWRRENPTEILSWPLYN